MKRLIIYIVSVCISIDFNAQITIPATHIPTIGDVFTYGVHNQLYTPKPIIGGVYDFSDLTQNDTTVIRYVANDKTIEYPNSNLKLTEDDNDQATVFFKKSGNDLFLISIGQLQQQMPIPGMGPMNLKGTMKYSSFPMTNTTNVTSSDEVKITIPKTLFQGFNIDSMLQGMLPGLPPGSQLIVDSIAVEIKLNLNLKAEGSGKIKTPVDNNIDVIKIVRIISGTPKIMLYAKAKLGAFELPISQDLTPFLGGQLPINALNITTHTFYSPNFRQEIVNATVDSTGKYQTVNYRYRTKNGVITNQIRSSNTSNLDFDLVNGRIEVRNLNPGQIARVSVYSLEGKKLQEKNVTLNDSYLSLSHWTGIRIVHVMTESEVVSKKIATQ